MAKPAICMELSERIPHTDYDFRLNIKRMMSGEHPFCRQTRNLLKRLQISIRVSGWKSRRKHILIHQITRIEITFFLLPKTHMPRRVSRHVQNLYPSSPDIDRLAPMQHLSRSSLEKFIGTYIVSIRQIAPLRYILLYLFQRLRKSAVQPFKFRFMRIKIRVIFVASDMVPVNMGGNGYDRLVR